MTASADNSSTSVIALAGRRIDASNAQAPRFPQENTEAVRTALARRLEGAAPTLLVASAACGSDLLALEAASGLGIRTRIVLPFPPDVFRQTSVIDRSNPAYWGDLYDRLIGDACERGDLIVLNCDRSDASAYIAANEVIIAEALQAAHTKVSPARLIAVIVWEGKVRAGDDATEHFRRLALERGFFVEQISTLMASPRPRSC